MQCLGDDKEDPSIYKYNFDKECEKKALRLIMTVNCCLNIMNQKQRLIGIRCQFMMTIHEIKLKSFQYLTSFWMKSSMMIMLTINP